MKEKDFVPFIEGRLDPAVRRRLPVFVLAATHAGRVVRLEPGFSGRSDHLERAGAAVRAHRACYVESGLHEAPPIAGYRYFAVPGRGYRLGVDGRVLGAFRGRPVEAHLATEVGEAVAFGSGCGG